MKKLSELMAMTKADSSEESPEVNATVIWIDSVARIEKTRQGNDQNK